MEGPRGEAAFAEILGQAGRGALGPGEDDRQPPVPGLQDAGHDLGFVEDVAAVDQLPGRFDGRPGVGGVRGADVRRLGHVPAGHGDDGAGHGGREQHGVAGGRRDGEDPLNVFEEAEIEPLTQGGINIIFFNKMFYDMGNKDTTISDLKLYLNEKYGKDIAIEISLRENRVVRNTRYVSIDEIKSVINTDIIIE